MNFEETTPPVLVVTEEMRSHIYEIAKWTSFLAIVGFVFAGIATIGAFTVGSAMQTNPELSKAMGQMGNAGGSAFTIIALIWAFVIFYPSLLMFKYATKAKLGVLYGEQANLNEAFAKLKSLFKFWGVAAIVFVSFYLLAIVASVVGLAAA